MPGLLAMGSYEPIRWYSVQRTDGQLSRNGCSGGGSRAPGRTPSTQEQRHAEPACLRNVRGDGDPRLESMDEPTGGVRKRGKRTQQLGIAIEESLERAVSEVGQIRR